MENLTMEKQEESPQIAQKNADECRDSINAAPA